MKKICVIGSLNMDLVFKVERFPIAGETLRRKVPFFKDQDLSITSCKGIRKIAHEAGVITVLNPAPARELQMELFKFVDYLTPNESEFELLAKKSALRSGRSARLLRF